MIVTDSEAVPPALVAVQVRVVPVVSLVIVVGPQPDDDEIADSLSTTVHVTVTSLVYQPLFPSVPLTFGVTTGGVESVTGGGSTWSVKLAGAVFQVLPDLPPVTVATLIVYVPGTPDVNDTALAFAGPAPDQTESSTAWAVTFCRDGTA